MSESFPTASLDEAEIFFTNLLLLGFEPAAMERKYRIPFNKDMFILPNKKGFEAVARFLFSRLDEARCQEEFRDCWNVRDKKEEQMFRKVCNNWLVQIAKDDPQSYLPRIVSSLFMSPGGEKFNQFMLCFSRYVLHRAMLLEHGAKNVKDFLGHPILTTQNVVMAPVMVSSIMAGSIRQRQKFLQVVRDSVYLQQEWNKYAVELTKDYRRTVKRTHDLLHKINEEKLSLTERTSANMSPKRPKHKPGITAYDFDIQAVKRARIVQQVRDMWKVFDDFDTVQSVDREIIDSILQGTLDKYRIDAAELNIKIPDLLLRRCEQELQRRNVEDVYQGGKVNLLSLIHLWNLSLHLYAEKLHETGVPRLDVAVPSVTTMVEAHRAHCANLEDLRHKLELNLLPDMKQSIEHLKRELDKQWLSAVSPGSLRITPLGLGLLPPTPPISFEPCDDANVLEKGPLANEQLLKLQQSQVTTPEGALQLMKDINNKVQYQHSGLIQGVPVYAPTDRIRGAKSPSLVISSAATAESQSTGTIKKTAMKTVTKPVVKDPSARGKVSRFPSSHVKGNSWQRSQPTTQPLPSQTSSSKLATTQGGQMLNSKNVKPITVKERQSTTKKSSGSGHPAVAKVDRHYGVVVSSTRPISTPLDTLASNIANAICLDLSEDEEKSKQSPVEEIFHEDAFCVRDKLEHTPPSVKRNTWHDTLLHDSIGPLSSTHIDSPLRASVDHEIDQVAVRLFSHDLSVGEDEITKVLPDDGKPSEEGTPRFSSTHPRLSEAGCSPIIRSAGCTNSQSEGDIAERPEALEVGDKVQSHDDSTEKLAEDQTVEEQWNLSSDFNEHHRVMENLDRLGKEGELEEENEDEERIDPFHVPVPSESFSIQWKNIGLKDEMFGSGVKHSGHKSDDTVGKGQGPSDGLDLSEHDPLTHVNETLQFLQKTKTPCLPARITRSTSHQLSAGSPDVSPLQETTDKNKNPKHSSVSVSEPGFPLHYNEVLLGANSSLPFDFHRGPISLSTRGKTAHHKNDKALSFDTSIYSSRQAEKPIKTKSTTDEAGVKLKNEPNKDLHDDADFDSGNNRLDTTVRNGHDSRSDISVQSLDSNVSSSNSDIDSLILRYQNLRLQQDIKKQAGETNEKQSNSSAVMKSSLNLQNSDAGDHAASRQTERLSSTNDYHPSSSFDGNPNTFAKNAFKSAETPSHLRTEMLQDEDFEDVKRFLLESSFSETPCHQAASRLSLPYGDILAPSPLTEAVHSTDVSFAQLNESAVNLLDFDDSILVPSSPSNVSQAAVATEELIDLS